MSPAPPPGAVWPPAVALPPGVALWQRAGVGRLQLWPHKAAFDPDLGLLLVADAHIGKAQSFRRLGVPVPAGTTAEALDRLSALLQATGATQLVFLGDFLHAATGRSAGTLAALAAWRDRHPALALTLVRGNHDAHAGDPPASLGMAVVDEPLRLGPWALQHHPAPVAGAYALAGHVHPGVLLQGRARQRLRLPAFCLGAQGGLLPAFGGFTGLHLPARQAGEQWYAVADGDQVLALP